VRRLAGHSAAVTAVAFTPDGRFAITGALDGRVVVWDAATGAQSRAFDCAPAAVWSVACSPDGRYVAAGTGSRAGLGGNGAQVWDLATAAEVRSITGSLSYVSAVAFAPYGVVLLTASLDGTIAVTDLERGNSFVLSGGSWPVECATF